MKQNRQRAVALVITLIMLSVITVIAVAFLAVSRRERTSVSHSVNYIDAELAMNTALERAKAEILAHIIGTTNLFGPGLMVAVNIDGSVDLNGPIAKYDQTTIARLTNDARVPVFVKTNRSNLEPTEFRYYLDLNRNARPDTNGFSAVLREDGQPDRDLTGAIVTNYMVGDPEWLGILVDPLNAHSRYNRFGARYTFAILPSGRTLDINFMHNHAKRLGNVPADEGFYRNQGAGTFEMNLAAFLTDLNTNIWNDYDYRFDPLFPSIGRSFDDATSLLNYRYGGSFANLPAAIDLFSPPNPGLALSDIFATDLIDFYADGSDGAVGTVGTLPALFPPGAAKPWPSSRYPTNDNDQVDRPWPGADSRRPNRFFGVNDFWNSATQPSYANFVSHLSSAMSNSPSTYDQATFYRMISQLGTESIPEQEVLYDPTKPRGPTKPRININYRNVDLSVTSLEPWTPLDLFTTIASRLLGEEYHFGTTNIPVFTNLSTINTNTGLALYNPRIHQILQIAANVVESTRGSKVGEPYPYYPHVYQPLFTQNQLGDVFIRGYEEVPLTFRNRVRTGLVQPFPLDDPTRRPPASGTGDFDNNTLFFGIPLIVGARKGFPNFNECSLQTAVRATRKLQVAKNSATEGPRETNVMSIIGVSNVFGIEVWNSYSTPYPRAVELLNIVQTESQLTNSVTRFPLVVNVTNNILHPPAARIRPANWPGAWTPGTQSSLTAPNSNSFWVPTIYQQVVQADSVYYQSPTPHFEALGAANRFETANGAATNRWGIAVTNRLVLFMFDDVTGQLFDAVSLSGLNSGFDITTALSRPASGSEARSDLTYTLWDPTPEGTISEGVIVQLAISMPGPDYPDWNSFGATDPTTIGNSKEDAKTAFFRFVRRIPLPGGLEPTETVHNAPFVPTRKIYQITSWHANDPLVHYSLDDLRDSPTPGHLIAGLTLTAQVILTENNSYLSGTGSTLGWLNTRYRPWAYDLGLELSSSHANDIRPTVKDPNVRRSDDWDFPTNKFPNIGWLGRVHRGTPWQTIYLKSWFTGDTNESNLWFTEQAWSDQVLMSFMKVTDLNQRMTNALVTAPTNDWRLLDTLTASLHPNASRGRLSVNQDQLAAWSAVLSGVPVTALGPISGGLAVPVDKVIEPAMIESGVQEIVDGINAARAIQPDGQFHSIGDILNAPQLTLDSPYLVDRKLIPPLKNPLYDADFERIPQQIMSLLKVGDPRFVIYAYGQSLKPAANSVLASGANFGMCTNYQITAEAASRAVVRVEFPPLSTDPLSPDFDKPDVTKPRLIVESFNLIPMD